jgi:ABC-2 type transport system permease protein
LYRLQKAGLSEAQIRLAVTPVLIQARSLAGEEPSLAEMLVPYAVVFILVLAAIFSGQVLMFGVIKEKRNRIVEILLSSVSSLDLLVGKLVGFAALGLMQVAIWLSVGLAVAARLIDLSRVSLAAANLVPAILFFISGYLLFASLFAAMGATMKDAEGGGQAQGMVILVPMIPLFAAQAILMSPNALWVRIMSFVPPFIPVTVLIRMAATTLPWWEIASTFVVLLLSVVLFVVMGARIFERGILHYDRTISLKEIQRMLKKNYS